MTASSNDTLKMAMRLWYLDAKDPKISPAKADTCKRTAALATIVHAYIVSVLQVGEINWEYAIINPMGGNVTEVASVVLLILRKDLSQTPLDFSAVVSTLKVILKLYRHTPIAEACVSQNFVPLLINTLTGLAALLATPVPADSDAATTMLHCVELCVDCSAMSTLVANGVDSMVQIVEAQTLSVFLKLSPWMDKICSSPESAVLGLVSNVLPVFLVYLPVLRAVEKSLSNISELGLEADVPKSEPFSAAWVALGTLVEERSKLKGELKSMEGRICDSKQVFFCVSVIICIHFADDPFVVRQNRYHE